MPQCTLAGTFKDRSVQISLLRSGARAEKRQNFGKPTSARRASPQCGADLPPESCEHSARFLSLRHAPPCGLVVARPVLPERRGDENLHLRENRNSRNRRKPRKRFRPLPGCPPCGSPPPPCPPALESAESETGDLGYKTPRRRVASFPSELRCFWAPVSSGAPVTAPKAKGAGRIFTCAA